ncbi:MAG: MOSC domain-containing protein [Hyphomonadaceae bacterium]
MITHLTRYPVKGLSGEALEALRLIAGEGIAGDRAVAIAREAGVFDPRAPEAKSKLHFLMLAKDEALAALDTQFDDGTQMLTVRQRGDQSNGPALMASVQTDAGRAEIAQFFKTYLGKDGLDPQVVSAAGHKFTDISVVSAEKMRAISLVNIASVRALEEATGRKIDHRRFRANVYFDGVPAWDELNWVDRTIGIGEASATVVKRTKRCPATDVNPDTAARDINLPAEIRKHFGHFDMGIYAEVQASGEVSIGDALELG